MQAGGQETRGQGVKMEKVAEMIESIKANHIETLITCCLRGCLWCCILAQVRALVCTRRNGDFCC